MTHLFFLLSVTPDVAEKFKSSGTFRLPWTVERTRLEFFRDNIHFPPSISDEPGALVLTSAFQTAKMSSHCRHTDDFMDYFTFNNMLSAVCCTRSIRGMGKKKKKKRITLT